MKIHWLYILLAGFIAGLLVSLPSCEKQPSTITKTDTVRVVEIKLVQLDPVSIEVPVPYAVIEYIPVVPDPPDYNLDKIRAYADTAHFEGLSLRYDIKTRGELLSAVFWPAFEKETIIKTITITESEAAKPIRGLYAGLAIGGNKSQFGTLAPQLNYVNAQNIFGVNYNLLDNTINIGISRKIF